jgi:hypothetical protein
LRERQSGLHIPSGHELKGKGFDRGHLLADTLGGSGKYVGNVATMTNTANKSRFAIVENSIRGVLNSYPTATIRYRSEAKFPDIPGGLDTWLHDKYGADLAKNPVDVLFRAIGQNRSSPYTLKRAAIVAELSETAPRVKTEKQAETICKKIADYYWPKAFEVTAHETSGISPAVVIAGTGTIPNT